MDNFHPPLDSLTKGIPGQTAPFGISEIKDKAWNVLAQDMPLPLAVIKESALRNNADWIAGFAKKAGVLLCPHGKTTMSPEIFRRQLRGGAWGITLSTAHQVHVARRFNVPRIFLANQIVDPVFLDFVLAELQADPQFDFYCLADSTESVALMHERARRWSIGRPLQVLVEIGIRGGRTGCRNLNQALDVANAVSSAAPYLSLVGVEGFEGIAPGATAEEPGPVRAFLDLMVAAASHIARAGLFSREPVILSAGGSAFFDIVAERLQSAELPLRYQVVLRSGCYVTHDSGMYVRYFSEIEKRSATARGVASRLQPAIELLAYVQSLPEQGRGILAFGKRDCSYDIELPTPVAWLRPGNRAPAPLGPGFVVSALNDQHAYLQLPAHSPLRVGDIVILGISHPCTTFDKWDVLYGVDDDYNVVSAFKTYF